MKQNKHQTSLMYDWHKPVTNMRVNIKANSVIENWPRKSQVAYITSLGPYWSINGGKLSVFKNTGGKSSGYLVVDGYDMLFELFEVEFETRNNENS